MKEEKPILNGELDSWKIEGAIYFSPTDLPGINGQSLKFEAGGGFYLKGKGPNVLGGGGIAEYEAPYAGKGKFYVGGGAGGFETGFEKRSPNQRTKGLFLRGKGGTDAITVQGGLTRKFENGPLSVKGEFAGQPTFHSEDGDTILDVNFSGKVIITYQSTPLVKVRLTVQGNGQAEVNISEVLRRYAPPPPVGDDAILMKLSTHP